MPFESAFVELSVILLFAAAVGFAGLLLKQPLIVSFIVAGILAGPSGLDLVRAEEHIDLLAEFGVSLLLFVVGLKLDLHLIRSTGAVALTTGLGQVLFTSVVGYLLCLGLGLTPLASLYVAVALTFSSTIIIVKLLTDKGEIDALHGRVALGFLIVQDMVVVLAMIALSALGVGQEAENGLVMVIAAMVAKGALLLGAVALFVRYLAEPLLERLARSPELMVLLAVGLAVAVASVSDLFGFSKEMGALLAGVAFASTRYRDVIGARLMSLRDFMLLFFFIGLGAHLDFSTIGAEIPAAVVLSLFVLIGNPLIVMVIMGVMGYRRRTGFLAGLTVAQISEFSLVFMALGASLGHVEPAAVGLVTLVGLITIGLSTYMILYSQHLYRFLEPWLGPFERTVPHREARDDSGTLGQRYDVLLFGLGRYGRNIARHLDEAGLSLLGIDFDPDAVRQFRAEGHRALYGDAADPDFAGELPIDHSRWVVLAMPTRPQTLREVDPAITLIRSLRARGYRGGIAATAHRKAEAAALKAAGADLVLRPFDDAARGAVEEILRHDPNQRERQHA